MKPKGGDEEMGIRWLRTFDIFGWTLWIDRFEEGGWSIGFCRSLKGGDEQMKRVSIDTVLSWHPCEGYTRRKVTKLFAGRKTVSALNVLDMKIPDTDKCWAAVRPELLTDSQLHEVGLRYAERLLTAERGAGREPDPRSWAVLEVKRRWLKGEATDEELRKAARAAWAARTAGTAWAARTAGTAWAARAASAAWAAEAARAAGAAGIAVEVLREVLEEER